MKKLSLVLVSLVVLMFINVLNVAAKPVRPPADCGKDADHDGWCVKDPDRGDKLVGTEDCNDADKAVNPGANEVLDDGIDNDCDGADLVAPANIKAWGCSTAKCVTRVQKEIEDCDANADKCSVNYSSGKFVLAWGAYMIDTDCDGIREVLDQDGKDTYDDSLREGSLRRCGGSSGGSKKAGGSAGAATGTSGAATSGSAKPAAPTDPKFDERLGKAEEGINLLDGRVDDIGNQLIGFTGDLDALDKAILGEAEARAEADAELADRINVVGERVATNELDLSKALSLATTADERAGVAIFGADSARSAGVSAGLDVGFALIGQADVSLKGGKKARPGLAPTILIGGHVGAEFENGLYRAFGAVGVPYEAAPAGHTENGLVLTAGLESLFKLSSGSAHSVGPIARFIDHESGGDVLGVNAKSRGATVGVAYEFDPQFGSFRVPIHVSVEGGAEQVGTQGHEDGSAFKAIGVVPVGLLSLTLGASTGSAIR